MTAELVKKWLISGLISGNKSRKSRTNMASHTNLYKFGWHTSTNSARIKNSRDLILGEVVYIAIIYHIPDSWIYLWNGFDFYFWSHDWWKPRIDLKETTAQEKECIVHKYQLTFLFSFFLFLLWSYYVQFYNKTKLLTSLTTLTNFNDITHTGKAKKKVHSNQLRLLLKHYSNN